ncbi:hypothetical protein CK203_094751 [Vitis vinifera]|uniref:Uncharacterized protein n=1 Tax=Vitis vinifera TaxID=29760 RepID=A0A438EUJ8_VITVI|nr:hypothetical protein CK203_094751 [Vitis vinifera]
MHGLRLDHPLKKRSHFTNGVVSKIADKVDTMKNMMTQHWQKAPNFVHGIRELSPVAPWLGSRAGTMQGPVPPWLGSRAPSKASCHLGLARGRAPCKASCHLGLARGHQARPRDTLAWLTGTMQGPVARVMARAVARVTCLWLSFQVSMPLPSFLGKNDMGTGWGGSRPVEASKVTIGCKISETVKGKLSLGARILQLGGVKRVFKQTSTRREAVEDFPMLFINSWPYRWPPLRGLHFPVRDQSNSILQIANWLNSIQDLNPTKKDKES